MTEATGGFAEYAAARWLTLVRSAVLLGCTPSEAEDVAQETLTRCLVGWTKVTAARHRDAYVSAILLNCFRDSRRSGWRRRERSVATVPDASEPDRTDLADTAAAIEAALGTLSPGQREVLTLRFYLQLGEAEVAEALGVAVGTVKSRTARALAVLAADTNLADLHDGGSS